MQMLIITTESHQPLAVDYFRATLPPSAGVTIKEQRLDLVGDGSWASESWQKTLTSKLVHTLEFMEGLPPDAPFSVSDVDIQFFDGFSADALTGLLERKGTDVLWQKEHKDSNDIYINPGFYVARNSPWFRDLLERSLELCATLDVQNDQTAINQLLEPEDLGKHWGFLPGAYYARSHGFPPGPDIVLHHANFSGTIPQKIGQLNRVRKYVTGGMVDRWSAMSGEGLDFVRSGKLRLYVRSKVKRS
jgi:hypothetical protein